MQDGKLISIEAEKYKSTEDTDFLLVESEENLKVLKTHLEEERVLEIAIDLEAHTMRSYQGLTCLM